MSLFQRVQISMECEWIIFTIGECFFFFSINIDANPGTWAEWQRDYELEFDLQRSKHKTTNDSFSKSTECIHYSPSWRLTHSLVLWTKWAKKKKNYLFRFKLSVNPKYELRIFGMAVFSCGSRSTIFGFGDKLNAKFVTQQLNKTTITIQ